MVVALAACGDNLPYESAQDGSRLRLQWYELADGSRQVQRFAPFFDAALNVECTRQTWEDGIARCTPVAAELMYSDPGCTTGVGASMKPSVAFHVTTIVDDRPRIDAMWLASEVIPTPPRLFAKLNGVCTPQAPAAFTTYALRVLGHDELVPLARGRLPSSERLAPVVIESADGLRSTIALYDRELDVECDIPTSMNQGFNSCWPNNYEVTSEFQDAECTIPVYVEGDQRHHLVRVLDRGWYRVGDPISPATVFRSDGITCRQIDVRGANVYEIGTRVEIADVRRRRLEAATRLQPYAVETMNVHTWALFDRELGVDCTIQRFQGVPRCLPLAATAELLFADPACTVPRPVTATTRSLRSPYLPTHAVTWTLADGVTDFFDFGTEVTDTVYQLRAFPAPSCEPFQPEGRLVRDLGPRVPTESFVDAITLISGSDLHSN